MRIRIGNDIKLRLELNFKNSSDANILSAQVFIVNKTMKQKMLEDLQNKTRFLSRFPVGRDMVDPSLNGLTPTEYNINIAGDMPYHCYPHCHKVDFRPGFGVYPNWEKKFTPMIDNCDLASYCPDIIYTEDRNVVEVIYPANAQLYTGDYEVIIVAKIFQGGYSANNSRTVTVDYQNAFTLVSSTEEEDHGDVTVDWSFGENFPVILSAEVI